MSAHSSNPSNQTQHHSTNQIPPSTFTYAQKDDSVYDLTKWDTFKKTSRKRRNRPRIRHRRLPNEVLDNPVILPDNTVILPHKVVNAVKLPHKVVNAVKLPDKVVNAVKLSHKVVNAVKLPDKVVNAVKLPDKVVNAVKLNAPQNNVARKVTQQISKNVFLVESLKSLTGKKKANKKSKVHMFRDIIHNPNYNVNRQAKLTGCTIEDIITRRKEKKRIRPVIPPFQLPPEPEVIDLIDVKAQPNNPRPTLSQIKINIVNKSATSTKTAQAESEDVSGATTTDLHAQGSMNTAKSTNTNQIKEKDVASATTTALHKQGAVNTATSTSKTQAKDKDVSSATTIALHKQGAVNVDKQSDLEKRQNSEPQNKMAAGLAKKADAESNYMSEATAIALHKQGATKVNQTTDHATSDNHEKGKLTTGTHKAPFLVTPYKFTSSIPSLTGRGKHEGIPTATARFENNPQVVATSTACPTHQSYGQITCDCEKDVPSRNNPMLRVTVGNSNTVTFGSVAPVSERSVFISSERSMNEASTVTSGRRHWPLQEATDAFIHSFSQNLSTHHLPSHVTPYEVGSSVPHFSGIGIREQVAATTALTQNNVQVVLNVCSMHQSYGHTLCHCENNISGAVTQIDSVKTAVPERTEFISPELAANSDSTVTCGKRKRRVKMKGLRRKMTLRNNPDWQRFHWTPQAGGPKSTEEGSSTMPDLLMSVYEESHVSTYVQPQTEEIKHGQQSSDDVDSTKTKVPVQKCKQRRPREEVIPIKQRPEIACSIDETVQSMLAEWPWDKHLVEIKTISYKGDNTQAKQFQQILKEESDKWIKVTVTGYPPHWTRQQVLDTLINWEGIAKRSLTPCFVEFTSRECKFLVSKCLKTLEYLFSRGLVIYGDDYRMNLTISQLAFSRNTLPCIRFRLNKFLDRRLNECYDKKNQSVDFTSFLLEPDISTMCHFPLSKIYNQTRAIDVSGDIDWKNVTKLILDSNKLSTLEGFGLLKYLPRLHTLDLGYNSFTTAGQLASCRGMGSVTSLTLEGNPLCHNFISQDEYKDAVRLLFPNLVYLDGIRIAGLPAPKRNFCPYPEAMPLVEKFLEMYYGLLESKSREHLCRMYRVGAMLTISGQSRLRKLAEYERLEVVRACRDIRQLNEVMEESYVGNENIAGVLASWPPFSHDPFSFTVDVMQYTECSALITVGGVLRVLCEPRAEDCPMLEFTRTFLLSSRDGDEYAVHNDLWHVSEPSPERRARAFQVFRPTPELSLRLEAAPDDDLKTELIEVFMKLTSLKRSECSRCLEMRDWNIRSALQYFIQLLEDDELGSLSETPG